MDFLRKNRWNVVLIFFLETLFLSACHEKEPTATHQAGNRYVVVLSMDGFRWDYPDLFDTPVLDSVEKEGVRAEMVPVFPSKTFVNHYSLATGLYADNHGLVLNNFYAPDLNRYYHMKKDAGDGAFYGGEPIWVTAEKQGVKAATLFWVGSEAEIKGKRPSYWYKYQQSLPFEARIDQVERWLKLPLDKRPNLIMWYYHEPDAVGHHHGPESVETQQKVELLDQWLGKFFTRMKTLPVYDSIDFIFLSDHGMASLSPERQIILDEYVDTSLLVFRDGGNPVYNFKVKEGYLQQVYDTLDKVEHLQVWKHGHLPERFHYGNNPRTHDLTLVAEPGWSAYWSWDRKSNKGTHGYDNAYRAMHAIFYAVGPDFKKGYRQPVFNNVDVYELIARLLDLDPASNDGDFNEIKGMLK